MELMRSRMARSMRSESDAVLVFHEFADGSHATVSEVVDIVDSRRGLFAQVDEGLA